MGNLLITLGGFGELLRRKTNGKTLYQFAPKPNLDFFSAKGFWGRVNLGSIPEKAYFSFWGKPGRLFPGESYLRCLTYDLPVKTGGSLFLAKFLTHNQGRIVATDLRLTIPEKSLLLQSLVENVQVSFSWHCLQEEEVITLHQYLPEVEIIPPGCLLGQQYQQYLARGKNYWPLVNLVNTSSHLLEKHPVNAIRQDLGEPLANLLWLWGNGKEKQYLLGEEKQYCYFFSESLRLRGLALFLGWQLQGRINLSGETEEFWWLDFSLPGEKNFPAWVKALERLDAEILFPLQQSLQGKDWRILIIFDGFLRQDEMISDPWAIFLAATSNGAPRLRNYYRQPAALVKDFFGWD